MANVSWQSIKDKLRFVNLESQLKKELSKFINQKIKEQSGHTTPDIKVETAKAMNTPHRTLIP